MSGLRNYFRIVASLQLLLSIVTVGGFVLLWEILRLKVLASIFRRRVTGEPFVCPPDSNRSNESVLPNHQHLFPESLADFFSDVSEERLWDETRLRRSGDDRVEIVLLGVLENCPSDITIRKDYRLDLESGSLERGLSVPNERLRIVPVSGRDVQYRQIRPVFAGERPGELFRVRRVRTAVGRNEDRPRFDRTDGFRHHDVARRVLDDVVDRRSEHCASDGLSSSAPTENDRFAVVLSREIDDTATGRPTDGDASVCWDVIRNVLHRISKHG